MFCFHGRWDKGRDTGEHGQSRGSNEESGPGISVTCISLHYVIDQAGEGLDVKTHSDPVGVGPAKPMLLSVSVYQRSDRTNASLCVYIVRLTLSESFHDPT